MSADSPSPMAKTVQTGNFGLDATVASALEPALDATVAAPSSSSLLPATTLTMDRTTVKGTVLPKFTENAMVHEDRLRYEVQRVLGEGGMGEVALAMDHDIGRSVAIKHLHANTSRDASSLARFVEEIRTVGSLEHPNIVPIHDVGVEADGRYFFVMKHVEGETLEGVIEKLVAGDPQTHATYTFTRRVEIMIGLLRALQYAHSRGIVHRDIKPANVMVGKYGEVVLMDWGVAKATKAPEPPRSSQDGKEIASDDSRMRLFTTRHGSLVGTPAYMSPEQARGENTSIDERSDLYSATVLFHELLSLRHYLSDKMTLPDMIRAVIEEEPSMFSFSASSAAQPNPPAELMHACAKGLRKDSKLRFQTAGEMIDVLERVLDGQVAIQCPFTFTKRVTREMGRFVDRYPILAVSTFFLTIAFFLFSIVMTVRSLL